MIDQHGCKTFFDCLFSCTLCATRSITESSRRTVYVRCDCVISSLSFWKIDNKNSYSTDKFPPMYLPDCETTTHTGMVTRLLLGY